MMNININLSNLTKSSKGSDSKYFTTTKKGEIFELKEELRNPKLDKKREAIKKVIAAMTVGKDVSMLFTDVVVCMQTGNVELKKLVYLYLINYAKSNPDLAILAVNTFRKDANDPNPLIRALAIRTMGCIRVDKITEHLGEPLRRALKDDDPYVRKTAAVCVAKLYDINPELAEDQGFLDMLRDLISDSNPAVVANAIAAMTEIGGSDENGFKVTSSILVKLLAALNECTEWGQVFILDAISQYDPVDAREAESIIERITPRLQHANSAVVMSSVKVILKSLDLIEDKDTEEMFLKKLAPPLVTLLSCEPEIQYVALRNMSLIIQKRPSILADEVKFFFCKYNDPLYVKMEKLEIMIRLASEKNIEQVLLEFKEYATEVDVDFVRKSVRAIGRCAIKLERAAERCINVLLDLIKTKVNYVVQEAIIVIKDIFRKYPNRYESIIATLCENLETLDEPEAKASMIWIIGEYAERIDNADELLESFLDAFHDETASVQLQMLTATVKLFLKKPDGTKELMENVLSMATEHSDNPDLRDRGYIYWRLLSSDPQAAQAVVLAEKPTITDDTALLDTSMLDLLIDNISTLASVYHKPPKAFVQRVVRQPVEHDDEIDDEIDEELDLQNGESQNIDTEEKNEDTSSDLLDFGLSSDTPEATKHLPNILSTSQTNGFRLDGQFARRDGKVYYDLLFVNDSSETPLSKFAIQFNKNTFALGPSAVQIHLEKTVLQGNECMYNLPIVINPKFASKGTEPTLMIQVALKSNDLNQVFYWKTDLPFQILFVEDGRLEKKEFLDVWKSIGDDREVSETVECSLSVTDIKAKFEHSNIFHIAQRTPEGKVVSYFSLKTTTGSHVLTELTNSTVNNEIIICYRSSQEKIIPFVKEAFHSLLM